MKPEKTRVTRVTCNRGPETPYFQIQNESEKVLHDDC